MDGQFEPLQSNLVVLGTQLKTASWDEHVPEIEKQIQMIKEQTCAYTFNKLP